jgi:catechol 2,3-dioxygenase-like lactoylglutathione lyase family enzyme
MPLIHSSRLDHTSYVVPDLNAAVRFFSEYFGFEAIDFAGPVSASDDRLTRQYAIPERAEGRSAVLDCGGTRLELVQWTVHGQALNPLRESSAPGTHLAIRVADVSEAVAMLKSVPRLRVLETDPSGAVTCFTPFGFQLRLLPEWGEFPT